MGVPPLVFIQPCSRSLLILYTGKGRRWWRKGGGGRVGGWVGGFSQRYRRCWRWVGGWKGDCVCIRKERRRMHMLALISSFLLSVSLSCASYTHPRTRPSSCSSSCSSSSLSSFLYNPTQPTHPPTLYFFFPPLAALSASISSWTAVCIAFPKSTKKRTCKGRMRGIRRRPKGNAPVDRVGG